MIDLRKPGLLNFRVLGQSIWLAIRNIGGNRHTTESEQSSCIHRIWTIQLDRILQQNPLGFGSQSNTSLECGMRAIQKFERKYYL